MFASEDRIGGGIFGFADVSCNEELRAFAHILPKILDVGGSTVLAVSDGRYCCIGNATNNLFDHIRSSLWVLTTVDSRRSTLR